MKNIVMMALLLAISGTAFAKGNTTNTPTTVPCTVGTNGKCVYPEATLKNKHIYKQLERFLRKIGK